MPDSQGRNRLVVTRTDDGLDVRFEDAPGASTGTEDAGQRERVARAIFGTDWGDEDQAVIDEAWCGDQDTAERDMAYERADAALAVVGELTAAPVEAMEQAAERYRMEQCASRREVPPVVHWLAGYCAALAVARPACSTAASSTGHRHPEDEARAIVGRYLDAVGRAEQKRRDEVLARDWIDPSFSFHKRGEACDWCDERREAWERVHPGIAP